MSDSNPTVTAQTKFSDAPDYTQTYIPKSTYTWKVVETEYVEKSKSSGNPMFHLTCEITKHPGFPDQRNPGQIVDPNGSKSDFYLSLTEKAVGNIKKFFKACGLPLEMNLEQLKANPNPAFFLGKEFLAIGYSKADVQIDELTKQPIKHPITGQEIVYYQLKIGDVFAL